jgi:hypothetical protein
MRRHLTRAKIFDESSHVVGLVGTESDMVIGPAAVEQRERRLALGSAGCACDRGADGEAIAVLHQHVAHEAQAALATYLHGSSQKDSGSPKWG